MFCTFSTTRARFRFYSFSAGREDQKVLGFGAPRDKRIVSAIVIVTKLLNVYDIDSRIDIRTILSSLGLVKDVSPPPPRLDISDLVVESSQSGTSNPLLPTGSSGNTPLCSFRCA